jgi:hypothetical protein
VEHNTPLSFIRREAGGEVSGEYIPRNKYTDLSILILLSYFRGIMLGIIFIMIFDHYFWDIQQGSLMLWMTMGFIAGLNKKC